MSDIAIALWLAVGMSLLISVIEMISQAKARLGALRVTPYPFYLIILCLGNCAATLLATTAIEASGGIPGPQWFWPAFIGVFAFEALIQQLNVTLFDNGVLTIREWISKAREAAVAAVIQKELNLGKAATLKLAKGLEAKLSEEQINAHVLQMFGADKVEALNQAATQAQASAITIKALALAKKDAEEVRAILASLGK